MFALQAQIYLSDSGFELRQYSNGISEYYKEFQEILAGSNHLKPKPVIPGTTRICVYILDSGTEFCSRHYIEHQGSITGWRDSIERVIRNDEDFADWMLLMDNLKWDYIRKKKLPYCKSDMMLHVSVIFFQYLQVLISFAVCGREAKCNILH